MASWLPVVVHTHAMQAAVTDLCWLLLQETGKAAQLSIAQCIAVLCVSAGSKQTSSTVKTLLQTLQVGVFTNVVGIHASHNA